MKKLIIMVFTMLFVSTLAFAQADMKARNYYKHPHYPFFTIGVTGGAVFPLSKLSDSYEAGPRIGADLGYRINKEVSISGTFNYSWVIPKNTNAPNGNYMEFSIGPRYFLSHPKLRSAIFAEGGVGAYNFQQAGYFDAVLNQDIKKLDNTRAGIYGGLGATLSVVKNVDFIIKGKYHFIFGKNETTNFMTVTGGLNVMIP